MKLLFDQNLSPRLVQRLSELYPGSAHVYGLAGWRMANPALRLAICAPVRESLYLFIDGLRFKTSLR